jgi:hypothetical protein
MGRSHPKPGRLRSREGSVLIGAVILATISVIIVASILMLVTTQSRITQARWQSAVAFHTAESGAEYVLSRLRRSITDPLVVSGNLTGQLNSATFQMTGPPTFTNDADGRITNIAFRVQGDCGDSSRQIEMQLGVVW